MHPTEPSRAEALAAMTPEKLEEMARPAPRASHLGLHDFLEIPYDQLEEMNLEAKEERLARRPADAVREQRMRYLNDEKRIKAVTVCFTDLEGRMHMLDYDKKFLIKFAEIKLAQAERCPKALGTLIKASEVLYHHEVTNQFLWSQF
jgi:hypothetical protein